MKLFFLFFLLAAAFARADTLNVSSEPQKFPGKLHYSKPGVAVSLLSASHLSIPLSGTDKADIRLAVPDNSSKVAVTIEATEGLSILNAKPEWTFYSGQLPVITLELSVVNEGQFYLDLKVVVTSESGVVQARAISISVLASDNDLDKNVKNKLAKRALKSGGVVNEGGGERVIVLKADETVAH